MYHTRLDDLAMLHSFPLRSSFVLFVFSVLTIAGGLRMHPAWWRSRVVRGVALAALLITVTGFTLGVLRVGGGVGRVGVGAAWLITTIAGPLGVSLLVAGALRRVLTSRCARAERAGETTNDKRVSRRAVLETAIASIPVASVAFSASGLAEATTPARVRTIPMVFPNLHPDLDGLRVLQLSDLHLGASLDHHHLEEALGRATTAGFDLLVVTGDLADRQDELVAALAVLARYAPRLGVFASLGNHEYFHGVTRVRQTYAATSIPLLVDRGVTLAVGGARLFVAGANDPAGGASLDASIDACAAAAPDDAFKLLLCHRPRGFNRAARDFDLTLSGHTHGGQIGLFGKSLFEIFFPLAFLWGSYAKGGARLYTTSGFGHWFPFRAGCPTEAPIIVLQRSAQRLAT